MQANGPWQNHDAQMSSSDSDVDVEIDDVSPSQDRATAAWIERQRQCPEPFLSAPQLLLAKSGRIPASCAVSPPLGSASDVQALLPTPALALVIQNALGAQSSALVGSLAMPMSSPFPAPTWHADAQTHRLPTPTCSTGNIGADPAPGAKLVPHSHLGLKGSRWGHKPPLYPAKRGLSEDTDMRQQQLEPKQHAKACMSVSGQWSIQPEFFLCNLAAWLPNSSHPHLGVVQLQAVVQVWVCWGLQTVAA